MSPDRQALAGAIARRTKLADELARIRAAQDPALSRIRDASVAVERAEEELRDARAEEPKRLVDALLSGATTTTMADLTAAFDGATSALDAARHIFRALGQREREVQDSLDGAVAAVREAAHRVLRNSPEAVALVARLAEVRREIAAIQSIAASVPGVFAPGWEVLLSDAEYIAISRVAIAPWETALAALANDAAAPLPAPLGGITGPPSASAPGLPGGSPGAEAVTRPNGRA